MASSGEPKVPYFCCSNACVAGTAAKPCRSCNHPSVGCGTMSNAAFFFVGFLFCFAPIPPRDLAAGSNNILEKLTSCGDVRLCMLTRNKIKTKTHTLHHNIKITRSP